MTLACACVAALAMGASPAPTAHSMLDTAAPAERTSGDERAAAGAPRDPFVRPRVDERDAVQPSAPVPRAEGLAGLSIEELAVRGVLIANGRSVGFAQGPDKKHYVVRAGDRLHDGVVVAISADAVVVLPDEGTGGAGRTRSPVRRAVRARPEEK